MKKFKFLPLILIFAMLFIAGCGAQEAPAPEEAKPIIEKTETDPAPADGGQTETDKVAGVAIAHLAEKPSDNYMISAASLIEKMTAGESMTILDIRQADAYEAGHLKGAMNLSWGPDFARGLKDLPADQTIYAYCYSGQTCAQAIATMNMLGFDAKSISLGWNFGISQTEGYEAFTETETNPLGTENPLDFDPEVFAAIDAYYQELAEVAGTTFANHKISEADANANLDNPDFYFLSIRQEADYNEAHIPGAKNIPWGNDMVNAFDTLPKDKNIVVNCYTGQTAGQTVAVLRLLGYNAVSVNGGIGTPANGDIGYGKSFDTVSTIEEDAAAVLNNKPEHNYMIGAEALFPMIDTQEDMLILDIRQNDVYTAGHLTGAVNAPWGPGFAEAIEKLPMDKPIYVNCYSGQTAGQAVGVLNALGFEAYSIRYGWNLGISQTEGYEAYTEETVNELKDHGAEINEHKLTAGKAYFEGLAAVAGTTFANYKISEEDTYKAAMADDGTIFLDIRQNDVYTEGHIPGAINVPWGTEMVAGFKDLPKDAKIVVNCYSGQTAGQTVGIMRLMGFDAVSVNAGMGTPVTAPAGYANQGFELVQ